MGKKIIKALLVISFVFVTITSFGQITFQKTYPDTVTTHYGNSVVQLASGTYVVAGIGGTKGVLKFMDKFGNLFQESAYSFSIQEDDLTFSNLQTVSDGNLIVTGVVNYGFSDSRYYDAFLAKIDTLGNLLWMKDYGVDHRQWTRQVKQTNDGGYVLSGYNEIDGSASSISFYLIRTDSLGDSLWTKTYQNGYQQSAKAVEQTIDGGFVLVGHSNSHFAFGGVACVIKTDSMGNMQWVKYLTTLNPSGAYDVTNASNGDIVITGYSTLNACAQPFLMELDLNGHIQWQYVYDNASCGGANSITRTNDGGYAIVGPSSSDVYFIRSDSLGNQLWFRKFALNEDAQGRNIRQTFDGGFVLTGNVIHGNKSNVFLIKTNGSGKVLRIKESQLSDKLKIFPNPSSEAIYLQYTNLHIQDLWLTDLSGRVIKTFPADSKTLNVSGVAAGLYFLQVKSKEGVIAEKVEIW